jgi:hypothetical protein
VRQVIRSWPVRHTAPPANLSHGVSTSRERGHDPKRVRGLARGPHRQVGGGPWAARCADP